MYGKIFNLSPKKSENVPKVNFGDIFSFFFNTKEMREVFTCLSPRLSLGRIFVDSFLLRDFVTLFAHALAECVWSRTLKDIEIFDSAL